MSPANAGAPPNDLTSFVQRSSLDAYATAERLHELAARPDSEATYPNNELATRLRLVAHLVKSGFGTRVYYTVQPGYDTHAGQLASHDRLLAELSSATLAFMDDLRAAKLDDRVTVLCFSEFGRRVQENASLGTDHGTAGPVFLIGTKVKPGLHAKTPELTDLQNGDLKMSLDFRRVYAGLMERWLGIDSSETIAGFSPADLFEV